MSKYNSFKSLEIITIPSPSHWLTDKIDNKIFKVIGIDFADGVEDFGDIDFMKELKAL